MSATATIKVTTYADNASGFAQTLAKTEPFVLFGHTFRMLLIYAPAIAAAKKYRVDLERRESSDRYGIVRYVEFATEAEARAAFDAQVASATARM